MVTDLFEYGDILNQPLEVFTGKWKTIRSHWHYFTEIVYVITGSMTTRTEDKTFVSHPGDMIILHPRQIHSFESQPYDGQEFFCYCVKFDSQLLGSTIAGAPKLSKILENLRKNEKLSIAFTKDQLSTLPIQKFLELSLEEYHSRKFGYDIKINSYLNIILTHLIRLWQSQGADVYSIGEIDQFSSKDFSILEYIDAHSSEHLSIEDLARKCGMCYSNFAKQFKAQYGKTCKEYIEFIRICKADTMLLYTDKTLDYISQETGFTDASHFIRIYKKIRGITPKQRRQ